MDKPARTRDPSGDDEAAPQAERTPARGRADGPVAPPLAALHGAVPPRPRWFADALACEPVPSWHAVQGARIEALSWGERGAPGLLLLHGKMAHARWWSFIAPFFAATHRVVALSFSGMGGSGWRAAYSTQTWADEAIAVAEACGLFASAQKPFVVGHSFGGFVSLLCAQQHGAQVERPRIVRTHRQHAAQRRVRLGVAADARKLGGLLEQRARARNQRVTRRGPFGVHAVAVARELRRIVVRAAGRARFPGIRVPQECRDGHEMECRPLREPRSRIRSRSSTSSRRLRWSACA